MRWAVILDLKLAMFCKKLMSVKKEENIIKSMKVLGSSKLIQQS